MKLLKQLSLNIVVLALCFLCAPTLSSAQSPNGGIGNPNDERPKPPASLLRDVDNGSSSGAAKHVNATLDYIEYDLSETAFVEIWLYDETGMVRQSLRNDWQSAGAYGLSINDDGLPAGVYFYDIIINDVLFTRRFMKD